MVKPESETGSASASTTSQGGKVYWFSADPFEQDYVAGHGTHTAGSAAGATLKTPAETTTCNDTYVLSCAGGCIDGNSSSSDDDLVSSYHQIYRTTDIDRICPMFGCDEAITEVCLGDDVSETLTDHGGMAQGAKLAIFDIYYGPYVLSDYPGNDLWEACLDAGCKVHSNSFGGDSMCTPSAMELEYDSFMYQVR